jgi:hypothetical protein
MHAIQLSTPTVSPHESLLRASQEIGPARSRGREGPDHDALVCGCMTAWCKCYSCLLLRPASEPSRHCRADRPENVGGTTLMLAASNTLVGTSDVVGQLGSKLSEKLYAYPNAYLSIAPIRWKSVQIKALVPPRRNVLVVLCSIWMHRADARAAFEAESTASGTLFHRNASKSTNRELELQN